MKTKPTVLSEATALAPTVNAATTAGHVVTEADVVACRELIGLAPRLARIYRRDRVMRTHYARSVANARALIDYFAHYDQLLPLRIEWSGVRFGTKYQIVTAGLAFLVAYDAVWQRYAPTTQRWVNERLTADLGLTLEVTMEMLREDIQGYFTQLLRHAIGIDGTPARKAIRDLMANPEIIRFGLIPEQPAT